MKETVPAPVAPGGHQGEQFAESRALIGSDFSTRRDQRVSSRTFECTALLGGDRNGQALMPRLFCPRRLIQGRIHKVVRDVAFHFSWSQLFDVLQALLAATGGVLLRILSLPPELQNYERIKTAGWVILFASAGVALLRVLLSYRDKVGEQNKCRDAIWVCLVQLHKQVFRDLDVFRFTLFVRDPVVKRRVKDTGDRTHWDDILVPILRRESGQEHHSKVDSTTYFPMSSRAVTAFAWKSAFSAKNSLERRTFDTFIHKFPRRFGGRGEMEDYYQNKIGVEPELVKRIGGYMDNVVQIFSFPLVREDGTPIALLSVDSKGYFKPSAPGEAEQNEVVTIDGVKLVSYLELLRAMLMNLGFPNR